MTVNRKDKWRNMTVTEKNIDEYMNDLYHGTKGKQINQGVSFNKDDRFQMTLLRNAILTHGSFSGFVKQLLYVYFEKAGKMDGELWAPDTTEIEEVMTQSKPTQTQENQPVQQVQPSTPAEVVKPDTPTEQKTVEQVQPNPVKTAPIKDDEYSENVSQTFMEPND